MKILRLGFIAGAITVLLSASAPRAVEAEAPHLDAPVCASEALDVECEQKVNKKCCDRWLCVEDLQPKSVVIGTED